MPGSVDPVEDERSGLLKFLEQQRYILRIAAYGLTDEQVRATPTRSELSVGGLIKHVAHVEQGWINIVLRRARPDEGPDAADEWPHMQLHADETMADVLALYVEVAEETEKVIAGIADLGRPVPVPRDLPWLPKDVDAWSVRWVLLHLIEETARHAGHADLVREHVDGATAFPLMAAAEDWPETPWLKPWSPAAPAAQR